VNNLLEKEYSRVTPLAHRKKFAQFFTPFEIAELMAAWLSGNKHLKKVLEPAFGLGVFTRVLLKRHPDIIIQGFEIDPNIGKRAKEEFRAIKNIELIPADYLFSDWEGKYDGIICNPPYFNFHDYDNKGAIREIENRLSLKLNGLTNLYALFLLKSISQLKKNGRAAYIVPSEFLNADYGKLIKAALIKSGTLRHVIVIDFKQAVFDDALTTACILLFAKDNESNAVRFSNVHSLQDLSAIRHLIEKYANAAPVYNSIPAQKLNPDIKWRTYYQEQNALRYKNLVPFSNYAKVLRGIATGSNEYFTFNTSKAIKYKITEKNLLPCICKAADATTSFFTPTEFSNLKEQDKSVYLLSVTERINKHVAKYLKKGIAHKINKKYLTSNRNPWYALENRLPAPIWVSVFHRTGLRFIRNEAGISNLTCFHCIYPNKAGTEKIDLLFAYLLTDVAREIFEDNRREYGNGLKKFEPNDINKGQMLNLEVISPAVEKEILRNYNQYRNSVISGKPDKSYLEKINVLFASFLL
jgi:adenine-specific DNA-methyltransferase